MIKDRNSLVSVIVPIYKVEDYLDECVKSIVGQTYKNIEIILVNDGSPDHCPQKCDEWAKNDLRIRVVHKQNGGLSSARNAGLDVAKGEYIAFVDSDDFITPDYVEAMYNRICNDKSVGIVSGMIYRYTNDQTTPFNQIWNITNERITSSDKFRISSINQTVSYTVWNKIFRASLLSKVRFREGKTNEDTLFMYDLGNAMVDADYSMVEVPHYVYYYRYREDSICTSAKRPLALDVIQNLKDMMDDCKGKDNTLWKAICLKYSKAIYGFLDGLLLNDIWRPLYFNSYQKELRKIPFSYIISNYKLNDVLYIQLLKWMPEVRRKLRVFIESRKNN